MEKKRTDYSTTNGQENSKQRGKLSGDVNIIGAVLGLIGAALGFIGVISSGLINAGSNIYIKFLDIIEKKRMEEKEKQEEFERIQDEESIVIQNRVWEEHAGIEYLGYQVGTDSETTQFRVRPYLFCDVIYSTGKVDHCWIQNHYTQEEYLSEAGKVELLEVYEPGVIEDRMENLLKEEKKEDVETELYTLLVVEYNVREVSPEYVCYCLQNGKLQIQELKWGSDLIDSKEEFIFDSECSIWEWNE